VLDESGADLTQLRALVEAYEAEVERISGNGSPMTDFGKGVIAACQDMQAYLTARQAMGQATGGEGYPCGTTVTGPSPLPPVCPEHGNSCQERGE
jgi:hypothetical protein